MRQSTSVLKGVMLYACSTLAGIGLTMFLIQHDFSPQPSSPQVVSGVIQSRMRDTYASSKLVLGKQDFRYYDDTAGYVQMEGFQENR